MAIENNMVNIPLTNSPAESRINTPIENSIPKERPGIPTIDFTDLFKSELKNNSSAKDSHHVLKDFISKTLIKWTTASSALVNMISAPVRLLKDEGPIKKIINKISMFFTKLHLSSYSAAGLISAFEQKNPFLVFSFLTEGIAAFLGLDKIYLFRGIATGIDGAVAGVKDKYGKSEFSSFSEGFKESIDAVKTSFNKLSEKLSKDPMYLFKMDGPDIAIFASLTAALGGMFGMTVNEKIGSIIRDIAGALGDYGIFSLDNPIAKKSGFAYLAGSLLDFTGRIFNQGVAKVLGITHIDAFARLKDAFLEAAIACDRIGQFYFLRYNQKTESELNTDHSQKTAQKKIMKASKADLHKYQMTA